MVRLYALVCMALLCGIGAAGASEHRAFRFGDMEVIALSDIVQGRQTANHPELLVGLGQADAERLLTPGAMANSINCFLMRRDGQTILFDTGLGAGGGGVVAASLAAAGVKPEDIDVVIITHFHMDHVGGLARDGQPVYPRARLMLPQPEVEGNRRDSQAFLEAYPGYATFGWGEEILPGITALDAHGHTPGHTAYLLDSNGKKLLIIADLVHFATIQLPLPEVAVTYDTDTEQAVAARRRIFDRAVREELPVAGMHLAFPGIGRLEAAGAGYRFRVLEDEAASGTAP